MSDNHSCHGFEMVKTMMFTETLVIMTMMIIMIDNDDHGDVDDLMMMIMI